MRGRLPTAAPVLIWPVVIGVLALVLLVLDAGGWLENNWLAGGAAFYLLFVG